jgi:hypothetical protein
VRALNDASSLSLQSNAAYCPQIASEPASLLLACRENVYLCAGLADTDSDILTTPALVCGNQQPPDLAPMADAVWSSSLSSTSVPSSHCYSACNNNCTQDPAICAWPLGSTPDANWANRQHDAAITCLHTWTIDAPAPEKEPALGCDVAIRTSQSCAATRPEITSPPTVIDRSYLCECRRLCCRVPGVEAQWAAPPCDSPTRCTIEAAKAQSTFLRRCIALKSGVAAFSISLMNPCGWRFRYTYAGQPESNEPKFHTNHVEHSKASRHPAVLQRALKVFTNASPCTLYAVSMHADTERIESRSRRTKSRAIFADS